MSGLIYDSTTVGEVKASVSAIADALSAASFIGGAAAFAARGSGASDRGAQFGGEEARRGIVQLGPTLQAAFALAVPRTRTVSCIDGQSDARPESLTIWLTPRSWRSKALASSRFQVLAITTTNASSTLANAGFQNLRDRRRSPTTSSTLGPSFVAFARSRTRDADAVSGFGQCRIFRFPPCRWRQSTRMSGRVIRLSPFALLIETRSLRINRPHAAIDVEHRSRDEAGLPRRGRRLPCATSSVLPNRPTSVRAGAACLKAAYTSGGRPSFKRSCRLGPAKTAFNSIPRGRAQPPALGPGPGPRLRCAIDREIGQALLGGTGSC